MALYVPTSRRRRRTTLLVIVALLIGLIIGVAGGRLTAPTITSQVAEVAAQARDVSAGLRVLALHDQAGVAGQSGDGGAQLVLERSRDQLAAIFADAPWITPAEQAALLSELEALAAISDSASGEFGQAAEALADHLDDTIGGAT